MQINFKYSLVSWMIPLSLIVLLISTSVNFHYLVFHAFAEYFAVFVSLGISLITYYTYSFTKNRYLLFLGLGYFWVALLDIFHTQTYAGMHLYNLQGSDTSITFWISARVFEALVLFTAPFMRYREYKKSIVTILFSIITAVIIIIAMSFPPKMLIPGEGLTILKVGLEYFVIFILLLTLYINKKYESEFSRVIKQAMKYSVVLTILAEASFTLYVDVYGIMNVLGHIFKFLSFWVLLQAIIRTSLEEPYALMRQNATTYEAIPYPAIVVDIHGVVRQVNEVACRIINREKSAIIGGRNHDLYHPKSIDEESCPVCQSILSGEELEDCILTESGVETVQQYSVRPIYSSEDNVNGMVQVIIDITNVVLLEKSLVSQYRLLQNIIDTIPIRIFWKDRDGRYLGANNLFVEDAKLSSVDELIGKSDYELVWGKTEAQKYIDDDNYIMRTGDSKLQFEETQSGENSELIILSTSKVPLKNQKGEIIGVLGTYEDITKRKTLEARVETQKEVLKYQSHYDALTNLPNRVLLQDRLVNAINSAKERKSEFALLFIDLDQFKQINDTLGHKVGDEVLKVFTSRLKNSISKEDTLARIGGDEFTIILEHIHSPESASALAEMIIENAKHPITTTTGQTLYISSSIGISLYPQDSEDMYDLLKYSDSAMYKAKEEGRNHFQFYSPEMTQVAMNKVVIQNDLIEAIKNEEFVVYYQPQIDIANDKAVLSGLEALVRWEHPTLGQISPYKFIPIAEETGMIVELDRLVMKIAINQVVQWHKEGLNSGKLSLNLAMKQLRQNDFIPMVKKIIEDSECADRKYLSFEITESDLMTNPEASIEKLNILKELGVEIAIDDFGTGYSSLSYLKRLPVSKLKIDQSFTRGIPEDKDDVAIVKAIISLAKSLNLKLLAEGVETEKQKEFMHENGCHEIQGYLYAKPMPCDETGKFIARYQ